MPKAYGANSQKSIWSTVNFAMPAKYDGAEISEH
jgi:hypothetical protein